MNAFRELGAALDRRGKPVRVFFRNDDGGWADDELQALCKDFIDLELPLDIAVIPGALAARSKELIGGLINTSDKFAIHQHGFTHANNQLAGRSCEFGSDRNYEQQYDDISKGQRILVSEFGSTAVCPIFTPPWNRCTSDTVAALKAVGIAHLSRIVGSVPLDNAVSEIPVTIDWLKKTKGVRLNKAELVSYIENQFELNTGFIGVMLHHEHMDTENRLLFSEFIKTLRQSESVSFHSMMNIALSE